MILVRFISCDVTCAEPDGSEAVTKTAVYNQTPTPAALIVTPTIIAPPDGAGIGLVPYTPKTSAVTDVVEVDDPWTVNPDFLSGTNAHAVVYTDNKYIAFDAGNNNKYYESSDRGQTWLERTTSAAMEVWATVANEFGIVAVGRGDTADIQYSTDSGASWTNVATAALGDNIIWQNIAYGNGKWVAVKAGTTVIASDITGPWEIKGFPTDNGASSGINPGSGCLAFGNGKFVAMDNTFRSDDNKSLAFTSTDGNNWQRHEIDFAASWKGVTCANGKFVALNSQKTDSQVAYSTDGINWTGAKAAFPNYWRAMTYGDGKICCFCR